MLLIYNMVKKDLLSIVNWKNIILSIITFLFIGIHSLLTLDNNYSNNIVDLFFLSFAGPMVSNTSFIDNQKFLLIWIIYFFIIGDFFSNQYSKEIIYSLIRAKSIKIWWFSKCLTIYIFTNIYLIIGFITITCIGTIKLPLQLKWSEYAHKEILIYSSYKISVTEFLIHIFITMIISSFMIATFYCLINVSIKNSIYSFLLIIILISLSLFNTYLPLEYVKWLPSNHLIFSRYSIYDQNIPALTIYFSLIYNSLILIITNILIIIKLKKIDL